MADLLPWLTLPAAFLLDALIGDPPSLPHPIRWMGRAIERSEPFWRRTVASERLSGLLFATSLILGCWLLALLVTGLAWKVHSLLGFVVETGLLFYCLSAKSLRQAALEIDRLLAG